jgi:hypothetical protein
MPTSSERARVPSSLRTQLRDTFGDNLEGSVMPTKRVQVTKIWLIFAVVLLALTSLASTPVLALDAQDQAPGDDLTLGDEQAEHVLEVDILGRTGAVLVDLDGQVKTAWSANDWDETCFLIFIPGDHIIWEDDQIPEVLSMEKVNGDHLDQTPTGFILLSAFEIKGYAANGSECPLDFEDIELYLRTDSMQLPPYYNGFEMCFLDDNDGWTAVPGAGESSDGILEMPLNQSGCYAIFADIYASQLINLEANSLRISSSVENLWNPVTFAIKTGEQVTISTNITNVGEDQETFEIDLMIDGVKADSMEVELQSGESVQMIFLLSGYEPGEYDVLLAGLSGTFVVNTEINWFPILITLLLGGFIVGFASKVGRNRPNPQVNNLKQEPPQENADEAKGEVNDIAQNISPSVELADGMAENPKEPGIPLEFLQDKDIEPGEVDENRVELVNLEEEDLEEPQVEEILEIEEDEEVDATPEEDEEIEEDEEVDATPEEHEEIEEDEEVEEPSEEHEEIEEDEEVEEPSEEHEEMVEIHQMLEGIRKDMDQLKEIAIASLAVSGEQKIEPEDGGTEIQVEVGFLRENVLESLENGGKTFDVLLEDFEVEEEVLIQVLEDLFEEGLIKPIQKGNIVMFLRI